jgi:2-dehydropantoate 2-reductase
MKIAILGAGGVGGYYGGTLAHAGHDVRVLARGENLQAIRARGIEVRAPDERAWRVPVTAADDADALGEVDAAIVSVKSYSLDSIAPAVRAVAGRGAAVLPLLNGVETTERLEALGVPRASLLGGVTYISAVRVAAGVFERRTPLQRVQLGELDGGRGAESPRAERIAAAFRDAGAEAAVERDITLALWQKFVYLASIAAACGLARAPVGPLRASALGRRLIERAVREAVAVGRARGVALPADEEARVMALVDSLPAGMKPSLLLDLEGGNRTEVDVLSGAIARFAEAAGMQTPVHDTAAAALGVSAA